MSALLAVASLSASYGRAQILFGTSFHVNAGEAVTLLGRNGMGRSTTVKCLFGLLPVQAGSITFCGGTIHGLPSHRIARLGLGLVPEGRQVFPNLSVEENLIATARMPVRTGDNHSGWTLDRVFDLFPGLKKRRGNQGWQLSGGEQQMLAIGRALMTNPLLLVLDEATEGLAPRIRDEIWEVLSTLKGQGLAQIIVDKNVAALLKLADRHYVMEKGRVVWSGNSDALRDDEHVVHRYLGV
ncbi:ABC transporter ATP-binding protein [Caballeronia sp. KNU42]